MVNPFDGEIHDRRSIRLKGYDYFQAGAYFVTICTHGRIPLLGQISGEEVSLTPAGLMISTTWHEIPAHYRGVDVDAFVVMPNHVHGIIVIQDLGRPQGVATTALSLGDVVHRFKTMTTRRYSEGVHRSGWSRFDERLWQRNYFERVVRDDGELNMIRQYILSNPAKWEEDQEYVP